MRRRKSGMVMAFIKHQSQQLVALVLRPSSTCSTTKLAQAHHVLFSWTHPVCLMTEVLQVLQVVSLAGQ